jgi:hypothetical protein
MFQVYTDMLIQEGMTVTMKPLKRTKTKNGIYYSTLFDIKEPKTSFYGFFCIASPSNAGSSILLNILNKTPISSAEATRICSSIQIF